MNLFGQQVPTKLAVLEDDSVALQVDESLKQLLREVPDVLFACVSLIKDFVQQVSSLEEVHHEMETAVLDENVVDFSDVWVIL